MTDTESDRLLDADQAIRWQRLEEAIARLAAARQGSGVRLGKVRPREPEMS